MFRSALWLRALRFGRWICSAGEAAGGGRGLDAGQTHGGRAGEWGPAEVAQGEPRRGAGSAVRDAARRPPLSVAGLARGCVFENPC